MRKSVVAFFVIITMLLVALPVTEATGETSSDEYVTFAGQIYHGSKPMTSPNDMTITIYQEENGKLSVSETFKGKLTENGWFSVGLSIKGEDNLYISIVEDGYTVGTASKCMTLVQGRTDVFKIDCDLIEKKDVWYLTSEKNYITMVNAYGSVEGKIVSSAGGNPVLNGVKVTLYNAETDESIAPTYTHGNGTFRFNNVPTGKYKLVAESKGFNTYTKDEVQVTGSESEPINIEMTPNNDINPAHWMTLVGIVASLLLMIGVVIHIARIRRKSKSSLK